MVPRPSKKDAPSLPKVQAAVDQDDQSMLADSAQSLASELDPDLVRGVPLDICMQSWGVHFADGAKQDDPEHYKLSQNTNGINVFISHDWKTSRASKTVSLLIIFNSQAAACAMLLFSLITGLGCCFQIFPGGWLAASALSYLVFYIVLCFWQRIRRLFCLMPLLVFLDRLCIAQHDVELKQQGILGLAGFLDTSDKLLILWSPRYFTRLWCTYELATFLWDQESNPKPLEIMPVAVAWLLLLACIAMHLLWMCHELFKSLGPAESLELNSEWIVFPLFVAWMAPVLLVLLPMVLYIGTVNMADLLQLKHQLKNFSIRASECQCCTVNHRDPSTGETLICDRKLVFQTLRRWYGTGDAENTENMEAHLDAFDTSVRERLSQFVDQNVGKCAAPLRYILAMVGSSAFSILPRKMHNLAVYQGYAWSIMLDWFKFPAIAMLTYWLLLAAWKICARCRRHALCTLPLAEVLIVVIIAAAWLPFEVIQALVGEREAMLLAMYMVLMYVGLVGIYYRYLPSWSTRQQPGTLGYPMEAKTTAGEAPFRLTMQQTVGNMRFQLQAEAVSNGRGFESPVDAA